MKWPTRFKKDVAQYAVNAAARGVGEQAIFPRHISRRAWNKSRDRRQNMMEYVAAMATVSSAAAAAAVPPPPPLKRKAVESGPIGSSPPA